MNKRIKLISSVALAGVLAINVCNPKTLAATIDDYGSRLKGTHNGMAQFVLEDITDSAKINGRTIKTGETIDINGTSYTAIVYGDANSDGRVNANDAAYILKSLTGYEGVTLNDAQKEAANVYRVGSANITASNARDAVNILKFCTGSQLTEGVTFDKDENLTYTITVNDNNTVNNVNNSKSKIILNATNIKNGLTIEATDGTNSIGTITVNTSANQTTTQHIQENVDLSTLTGDRITITVKDGTTVVGRQTVINNVKTELLPKVTNVSTHRSGTETATLSLEAYGDTDITKIYYIIDAAGSTFDKLDMVNKAVSGKEVVEKEISGNKLTNYQLDKVLSADTSYTVYYVVQNSLGNISEVQTTIISKDNVSASNPVQNMTVSDSVVSWGAIPSATFEVNVKRGGQIVASIPNHNTNSFDISSIVADDYIDGTYTVSVAVNGTAENEKSSEVTSDSINVTRLQQVSNVAIEKVTQNNTIKRILKFTDSNIAENVDSYEAKIYTFKNTLNDVGEVVGFEKDTDTAQTVSITKSDLVNGKDITSQTTDLNKVYFAEVVVKPVSSKKTVLPSNSVTSNQIFNLALNGMTVAANQNDVTETSAKLTVLAPISIIGKTTNYKVEVYKVNNTENGTVAQYTKVDTKTVALKEDNTIVVDGLQNNTTYAFIVYASVDNEEIKYPTTDYIGQITTNATMPTMSGLTVVAEKADGTKTAAQAKAEALVANSGKVFVDASSVIINGVEYSSSNIANYANVIGKYADIMGQLADGDKVTVIENVINIDTTNTLEGTRDFSSVDFTDLTLNIMGNGYLKTIKTTNAKQVSLSGNGALFNIEGVADTNKTIILNNGVKVSASTAKTVTIAPNSNVTINNVKVRTTSGTTLTATGTALSIVANDDTLTIENSGNVTFTSTASSRVQSGTINLIANGAVKLITDEVNVRANINVTAKDGANVDLTDSGLNTGTKTITVNKSETATVTAKYNTSIEVPVDVTDFAVDYTDATIEGAVANTVQDYEAKRTALKNYLDSLGLKNMGATITTVGNTVTVTFDNTKAVNTSLRDIAK